MLLQAEHDSTLSTPVHCRTIWGMDTLRLHDQYWAAHGLQVVRPGDQAPIRSHANGYLLLNAKVLALFFPATFSDRGQWARSELTYLRLYAASYFQERVVTDELSRFVRFERYYKGGPANRAKHVIITSDPRIAAVWQVAGNSREALRKLRQVVPRQQRAIVSAPGSIYGAGTEASQMAFIRDVMRVWASPHQAINRARRCGQTVWSDQDTAVRDDVRCIGPVWIGAGRNLEGTKLVIGPVILWDDPAVQPTAQPIWFGQSAIDPTVAAPSRSVNCRAYHGIKRVFDLAVALMALIFSLPLYPLIIAAIWLEDGRPFFFVHCRETQHGQKFGCIKFRSMRKNAEKIKQDLAMHNQADGPQFYMENDPRLTRVGRLLRQFHLDEFPQFINVLLGHMAIVGPRPSPLKENQFCPQWREARLSVRPGITGLWQVKRTREKHKDFQEWIRYDIEYVENASLFLDLRIVLRTVAIILRTAASATLGRRRSSPALSETPADAVESTC